MTEERDIRKVPLHDFFDGFVPDTPATENELIRLRLEILETEVLPEIERGFRGEYVVIVGRNTILHGYDIDLLEKIAREISNQSIIKKFIDHDGRITNTSAQGQKQ